MMKWYGCVRKRPEGRSVKKIYQNDVTDVSGKGRVGGRVPTGKSGWRYERLGMD